MSEFILNPGAGVTDEELEIEAELERETFKRQFEALNPFERFLYTRTPPGTEARQQFDADLTAAISYVVNEREVKIILRLEKLLKQYRDAGLNNSAAVTDNIINEIQEILHT